MVYFVVTSPFKSTYGLGLHTPFERRDKILKVLGAYVTPSKPLPLSTTLKVLCPSIHPAMVELFENGYDLSQSFTPKVLEDWICDETNDGSFALVPAMCAPRNTIHKPRTGNVLGNLAYFAQDRFTPIYPDLSKALAYDLAALVEGVDHLTANPHQEVYVLPTNPGHHASASSFGGYCYLNWAFIGASMLANRLDCRIGILDIDFHCGNGTASLVSGHDGIDLASIHVSAPGEYPFCVDDDSNPGMFPVPPGTAIDDYLVTLERALDFLCVTCGAKALVVSLGFDTLASDEETVAPMGLVPKDFGPIGAMIRANTKDKPLLVIQEGGYDLENLAKASSFFWTH